MRKLCLIVLLGLAACTDTSVGLGIGIGSNGVNVRPTVTTNVGGVNVTVSN